MASGPAPRLTGRRTGVVAALASAGWAVLYFGLVTPAGLVLRLLHDPLDRRGRRASYWRFHRTPGACGRARVGRRTR